MLAAKFPDGCAHLDLAVVERVLAAHRGYIPNAARALGVSAPDLRRLTWRKPKLLEKTWDICDEEIDRFNSKLITALYGRSKRRQAWAADKLLSSPAAYDHPMASARAARPRQSAAPVYEFRWAPEPEPAPTPEPEPIPEPTPVASKPTLPAWPGPHPPPPLVAHLYAPFTPTLGSGRFVPLAIKSPQSAGR